MLPSAIRQQPGRRTSDVPHDKILPRSSVGIRIVAFAACLSAAAHRRRDLGLPGEMRETGVNLKAARSPRTGSRARSVTGQSTPSSSAKSPKPHWRTQSATKPSGPTAAATRSAGGANSWTHGRPSAFQRPPKSCPLRKEAPQRRHAQTALLASCWEHLSTTILATAMSISTYICLAYPRVKPETLRS